MPINEERIARLRDFGLSEYAARAYLALLDLGLTEARDVSTLSKVPTSKIYHILDQLHEKGLVIILPEFPKKYAPIPFNEYLEKLKRDHENAAASIERDRGELTELFSVIGDVASLDRGNFTVVRGRRNVLSKLNEIMSGAEREVLAIESRGVAPRVESYTETLARPKARGVRVRMLVPVTADTLRHVRELVDFAEVRVRDLEDWKEATHVAIAIVDNDKAIIVHFSPDDGNPYQGKDVAVFTDHQAMVATLRALLEPHWVRAPTLESKRLELEEGLLPEFTRFYATHGDALSGLAAAVARGFGDMRLVSSLPARRTDAAGEAFLARVAAGRGRCRLLLNVQDPAVAEGLAAAIPAYPNVEVRHVEPPTLTRFATFDEREALFSTVGPGTVSGWVAGGASEDDADLVIHTTHTSTVRSLAVLFEELWSAARPLDVRARELTGAGASPSPTTRFLEASEDALRASVEVVDGARREMRVVAGGEGLSRFVAGTHAGAAAERGVRIRILTTVTPESRDAAVRAAERAEVRHVPALSILGNSSDGAAVFVLLPRREGSGGPVGDPQVARPFSERSTVAVHSTDPVHVTAFDGFFDGQWEVGVPLADRLRELDEPTGGAVRLTPRSSTRP